jgi:NADH-quinone oxidoreductase subunit H
MRLGWKVFIPVTLVWLVVVSTAQVMDIGPWFTEASDLASASEISQPIEKVNNS